MFDLSFFFSFQNTEFEFLFLHIWIRKKDKLNRNLNLNCYSFVCTIFCFSVVYKILNIFCNRLYHPGQRRVFWLVCYNRSSIKV